MTTTITVVPPDDSISRYLFVVQEEDETLDIRVAENYRSEFQVQNYLTQLQKSFPGKTKLTFVSLDDIANMVGTIKSDKSLSTHSKSTNQGKVLHYFREAVRLGASDIHLTSGRDGSNFCYVEARVHGELQLLDCIDKDEGRELAATIIQGMSDVTEVTFNPNRQQDARIAESFVKPLGIFGARYCHVPAVGGLYSVMRIIRDDGNVVPNFLELGFLPEQIATFKRLLMRPEGIIILSGPTGSGKSTTLRTASASWLERTGYDDKLPRKRLLTIEDPPEGRIPGAIQTPIIADKSDAQSVARAWSQAISGAMRLDPDAILNGEIRDLNSAMAAIKAAMTGHLMMTTLHANDALHIIERLEIEGVPNQMIADPQLLTGLISQRLIQRLCAYCKKSYQMVSEKLSEEERKLIEQYCQTDKVFMRNYQGCEHCFRGINGRIVVAEVIAPDANFYRLYRAEGKGAAKTYWHEKLGGITRNQHVLHYVNTGFADPLSAHAVCPLDEDSYTLLIGA